MDRRNAIKSIAVAGAAAALPKFSAAEVGKKSQLKVGLVGCSGRGIGAVEYATSRKRLCQNCSHRRPFRR